jgi:arabinan endo-1,5-alpha-L-arabinosidase
MRFVWLLAFVTACSVDITGDDGEDVAAEDQFIADITPDTSGEIAALDGPDDVGDDIGQTSGLPAIEALAQGTYKNPLLDDHGDPLTCPDPSVSDSPSGGYRYFLVCTSDYDQNSFPIRKSNDLVHWKNVGYVFPEGKQPAWATTIDNGGRYWAPEIYRIAGKWVVYFATKRKGDGQFVIGVATSDTLRGTWTAKILHTSGEFNNVDPDHELSGGVIDPSVMKGADGKLYLYYAKQSNQIWVGTLSDDGLQLQDNVHFLFGVTEPWEETCVEGPEPYMVNGKYYLLYSGASTWTGTYAVGVAEADSPYGPFTKKGPPILHSGRGFIATGHSSHPTRGPDGNLYLLYHSLREPSHVSNDRKLMLDRFFDAGEWPIVHDGEPSSGPQPVP